MSGVEFVDGLRIREPVTKDGKPLPDYIEAKGSINRNDLMAWLAHQPQDQEWINIEVKVSKAGNWYVAVDNWKPDPAKQWDNDNSSQGAAQSPSEPPPEGFDSDDIPF